MNAPFRLENLEEFRMTPMPAASLPRLANLADAGVAVDRVNKVAEGRPHIVDRIVDGEVALIINTTEGWQSLKDSQSIRGTALTSRVPYFTTATASVAAAQAIAALQRAKLEVKPIQSYYN